MTIEAREFCYADENWRSFVREIGGQILPHGHSESAVFELMAAFAEKYAAEQNRDLIAERDGLLT